MLTRILFRSASVRKFPHAGIFTLVGLLVGIGAGLPWLIHADDSTPARARLSEPTEEMAESEEGESEEPEEPIRRQKRPQIQQTANIKEMAEPEETEEFDQTPQRVIGNGYGTMGRGSHLIGKTFGRTSSITPLEYMPYLLTDQSFVFADLRGFVTNNSRAGGNLGIGYRHLFDEWNAWGGASLWYDVDQSTSKTFQQVGLSFEGLIQQFEIRSNVYLPVTSSQTFSNSISNSAFVGNQLLYSRSVNVGTPLQGVDLEVGYSLPVLDRHIVRGFVGGYHFEGGSTGGVNGFKARVEGVINNTITAQALYTHDKLYGDNLMVGLSMQFPFAKNHPTTGWVRNTPSPFRFVERNYNVIVGQSQSNAVNQVAIDPTTDKPYVVDQVYAPASGGGGTGTPNGTSANPFASVAAAQAAGGDVIFVQSGSVLNQPITLAPGQHLFGQGNFSETLATTGGGSVSLPNLLQAAQSGNTATPIIQNVTGAGVTLASNTEVAGFNIVGSSANGISGNGVSGVSLHDLMFSSNVGDAINLTNSTGNVTIYNTQVTSGLGNGIVFNGGNADISYFGSGNSITAQGNGFVLENLTGGNVGINNLTVKSTGGNGLDMSNVATNVTITSLNASNTTGSAVSITGNTGATSANNTYNFIGNTSITSPQSTGFSVNGTGAVVDVASLTVGSTASSPAISIVNATNAVTFAGINLNTQNATGLYASGDSNLNVNGGTITTIDAPALNIQNSTIEMVFTNISVNGGTDGIMLQQSLGNFTIKGADAYGTGGTIQNTTQAGVLINSFGTSNFSWLNFVNNNVGIQSTASTALNLHGLQMNGSSGYAIDSMNDASFSLGSSILATNGAVGGGTIRLQANTMGTYTSYIGQNTITDQNGTAVQVLTQAGGAGATLNTQITTNTINGYHNGSSLIAVNWNGPLTSTIVSNTMEAFGSNMTGIYFQNPSTTASTSASFTSNSITFETAAATSGTGVWYIDGSSTQASTGSSTMSLTSNVVDFLGTGGTGFRYGLYRTNSDTITSNTVTDQAGGGTGMLFDNATSSSSAFIISNNMTLMAGSTLTQRGMVFSNIGSGFYLVTPNNTTSNWVYNATQGQALVVPSGQGTGSILVNNVLYTPPQW